MRTTLVIDSDSYILNVSKAYITSGEYAGLFVVWAVTYKTAKRGKGISVFLVENGISGLVAGPAEE